MTIKTAECLASAVGIQKLDLPTHRGTSYRREVDGLRAVAVLPVILFHAGFSSFSGGFVGVDVFFVISGYLITSLILSEQMAGRFSIIRFYERRARRILPALFFVMAFCVPFAWFWLMPSDMKSFSESLAAVSTFSSNFLFWSQSNYFDNGIGLKPLLHTWSLAVEEQYYVMFPLFIILAGRLGKRWMTGLMVAGCILSLVIAEWASYYRPEAGFYLLPSRGWELLFGAFAALYLLGNERPSIRTSAVSQILSFAGLALIFTAVLTYSANTPFPGHYAILPVTGTVLIILFATPETYAGKVLSSKPLVGIGLISYSAYLWHQPLFAFARHRSFVEPDASLYLFLIVVTIILAFLSWKFIETPFRRPEISRKRIFLSAGAGSAFFLALGIFGWQAGGIVRQYEPGDFALLDRDVLGRYVFDRQQKLASNPFVETAKPKILIIGDSFSGDIVNMLHESGLAAQLQLSTYTISVTCGNLYLPAGSLIENIPPSKRAGCMKTGWYSNKKLIDLMREADRIWLVSSWIGWTADLLPESVRRLRRDFGNKFFVFGKKILETSTSRNSTNCRERSGLPSASRWTRLPSK